MNVPQSTDERNARYDPMTRDELIEECEDLRGRLTRINDNWPHVQEVERLRADLALAQGLAADRNVRIALIADERDRLRNALSASRGQWIHSVNAKQCLEALGESALDVPAPLGAVLCLCDWNDDATEIVAYHPNCPAKHSTTTTEKSK